MINLTQHPASAEQVAAGVVNIPDEKKAALRTLLTFDELPSEYEILARAEMLAALASTTGEKNAMIGGAMWLMGPLCEALRKAGIHPFFSFSKRTSFEETLPDGSVLKRASFRHTGFVG